MNDQPNSAGRLCASSDGNISRRLPIKGSSSLKGWLRLDRWLPALMAAMLWLVLVYGLPLRTLRESRRIARVELTHLLQTDRPDPPAILEAFDRATEQVLFSVSGPYFILAVSALFFAAHLVSVKRRLNAAEHHIQTLRAVALGIDGVPLK